MTSPTDHNVHAAAPDMADALAAILVLIHGGASDDDLEAIEEHCRAALSKAWGRTGGRGDDARLGGA